MSTTSLPAVTVSPPWARHLSTLTCNYIAPPQSHSSRRCLFLQSSLSDLEGLVKPLRKSFLWCGSHLPSIRTYFIPFLNPPTAFKWRKVWPVNAAIQKVKGEKPHSSFQGLGGLSNVQKRILKIFKAQQDSHCACRPAQITSAGFQCSATPMSTQSLGLSAEPISK